MVKLGSNNKYLCIYDTKRINYLLLTRQLQDKNSFGDVVQMVGCCLTKIKDGLQNVVINNLKVTYVEYFIYSNNTIQYDKIPIVSHGS